MTLRERLIEAYARAFVAHVTALSEPDNLTLTDEDLEASAEGFDSMLDLLAENADEWHGEAHIHPDVFPVDLKCLIAVLRGDE